MFEGGKSLSSIVAGLIVFFLGAIPFGGMIGIIGFTIPEIPRAILEIILAGAGFYLIIDGFFEMGMHPGLAWISIFFGVSCSLAGIFSILSIMGGLTFMTGTVINILYILIGILLIIGAFMF